MWFSCAFYWKKTASTSSQSGLNSPHSRAWSSIQMFMWRNQYMPITRRRDKRGAPWTPPGPNWIDSSGSQRRACLLRCLESAQVVDMQGDGAARSSPALELIKLQTQLAECPPPFCLLLSPAPLSSDSSIPTGWTPPPTISPAIQKGYAPTTTRVPNKPTVALHQPK